ncbi:MAG TPA: ubiquinone/menaquinone biosynthesis methyltransferase [Gemmatimonadota bacterium]|nr:ubiquinone/menaquinone biosynthesis methyltransferase [Gemmatimonadota bacterium]
MVSDPDRTAATRSAGAPRPAGREEKAEWVRAAFDRIAPRYDLFNDLLSAGVHRRWRARAIRALAPADGERLLDLCAGTMDLARQISDRAPGSRVVAADFALRMLASGRAKAAAAAGTVWPVAADALSLPFPDATFDGCTIGFGLRNLADYEDGLAEMRRVLVPGGRLVVLEFTTPPGKLFRQVYHAYFHHLLPRAGAVISGDADASRYLPDSVARFPDAAALAALLTRSGFRDVRYAWLTRGIAALHVGTRG